MGLSGGMLSTAAPFYTEKNQRLPTLNQGKALLGVREANYGVRIGHLGPIYSEKYQTRSIRAIIYEPPGSSHR